MTKDAQNNQQNNNFWQSLVSQKNGYSKELDSSSSTIKTEDSDTSIKSSLSNKEKVKGEYSKQIIISQETQNDSLKAFGGI
jgi:hypothetical protein